MTTTTLRRRAAAVAIAAVAALLLPGCSGSDEGPDAPAASDSS
jgi:hypothetical protein